MVLIRVKGRARTRRQGEGRVSRVKGNTTTRSNIISSREETWKKAFYSFIVVSGHSRAACKASTRTAGVGKGRKRRKRNVLRRLGRLGVIEKLLVELNVLACESERSEAAGEREAI